MLEQIDHLNLIAALQVLVAQHLEVGKGASRLGGLARDVEPQFPHDLLAQRWFVWPRPSDLSIARHSFSWAQRARPAPSCKGQYPPPGSGPSSRGPRSTPRRVVSTRRCSAEGLLPPLRTRPGACSYGPRRCGACAPARGRGPLVVVGGMCPRLSRALPVTRGRRLSTRRRVRGTRPVIGGRRR